MIDHRSEPCGDVTYAEYHTSNMQKSILDPREAFFDFHVVRRHSDRSQDFAPYHVIGRHWQAQIIGGAGSVDLDVLIGGGHASMSTYFDLTFFLLFVQSLRRANELSLVTMPAPVDNR